MVFTLSLTMLVDATSGALQTSLSTELSVAANDANSHIAEALNKQAKRVAGAANKVVEEANKDVNKVAYLADKEVVALEVVHPKPSKFDENIEDKIYVDAKNCSKLEEQQTEIEEPHQEVRRKKRSYRTIHR